MFAKATSWLSRSWRAVKSATACHSCTWALPVAFPLQQVFRTLTCTGVVGLFLQGHRRVPFNGWYEPCAGNRGHGLDRHRPAVVCGARAPTAPAQGPHSARAAVPAHGWVLRLAAGARAVNAVACAPNTPAGRGEASSSGGIWHGHPVCHACPSRHVGATALALVSPPVCTPPAPAVLPARAAVGPISSVAFARACANLGVKHHQQKSETFFGNARVMMR